MEIAPPPRRTPRKLLVVLSACACASLLWVAWLVVSCSILYGTLVEMDGQFSGTPASLMWSRAAVPSDRAEFLLGRLRRMVMQGPTRSTASAGGDLAPEIRSLLAAASVKKGAWFQRDLDLGPGMDPGPMPGVASYARTLLGDGPDSAPSDAPVTVALLATCSRVAKFGLNDMIVVGWLAGAEADQATVRSAQKVLSCTRPEEFDPDQWLQLRESWRKNEALAARSLSEAFGNETRISAQWLFGPQSDFQPDRLAPLPTLRSPLPMRWAAVLHETVLLPWLASDYSSFLRFMKGVREDILDGPRSSRLLPDRASAVPGGAMLTRSVSGIFDGLPSVVDEYRVRLRLACLGVNLEEYRHRHGHYPEALSDLGMPPGELEDPFTGRPFPYRRTPSGIVVYSVGRDGMDSGGRELPGTRGDIVWKVERPAGDNSRT